MKKKQYAALLRYDNYNLVWSQLLPYLISYCQKTSTSIIIKIEQVFICENIFLVVLQNIFAHEFTELHIMILTFSI